MKSIKQQYIDLKEGKMTQANFMRNLRMAMPQHVTNVTSFGDAVKILKNKGILNESLNNFDEAVVITKKEFEPEEETNNEDAEFDAMLKQLEDEMYGERATKSDVLDEPLEEDELTAKQIVDKYNEMFGKNPSTTFKDVAKALNVDEERVAVALGLTGIGFREGINEAKEVTNPNSIHPQEYTMGMKYELQCFDGDKKKAEKAVLKNLAKDPFYYTILKLSGNDVHREKTKKPEIAKKKKATKPELVDKANGMAKVKMPKTVKEAMEANPQGSLINTPDEKILQKRLAQYPTVLAAFNKIKETGEWDGLFQIIINDTSIDNASKAAIMAALSKTLKQISPDNSTITSQHAKDMKAKATSSSSKVANKVFSSPQQTGLSKSFEKGELGEADIPQDDKIEMELSSALSQNPTLKRILQKVDLPNEVDGTIKALLDRTNLKNIPDQIILAALRKVLNDQPGPTFTAQYAANTNIGKPNPKLGKTLKEKLTSMVREMLAEKEEAPSKKTAASEITAKAVDYIDDYNEGEGKEYKKKWLENVFDSYEDKVGHRYDDSVFEDVIDMLKAKGYTMSIKETFDGRDNLDAENEVN